jgi:hypothetical protein
MNALRSDPCPSGTEAYLLLNGRIATMDATVPSPEAVLTQGERNHGNKTN